MMGEQDEGRRYSPRELSDLVGYPINDVAYHVRVLSKYKALRKRGTEPVRGATKHFYALGDLVKENEDVVLLLLGGDDDDSIADASSAAARLRVPLPAAAGSASPGGPVSGRRWRAVCSTLFADGTVGPTIAEVDALSLSGVLTEIGERVEEADLDPEPDALGLTVTWEDRR